MKRRTISLLCLSILPFVSAFAEDSSPTPAADDSSTPAAVDNSGRNVRDRSGDSKTSGDQSNESSDIKMAAAIRRAVVGDDSLSMSAKNVKIIAENGMVTLRGPVKTAKEKATIAKLAREAAAGAKIDNQLEVEAKDKSNE